MAWARASVPGHINRATIRRRGAWEVEEARSDQRLSPHPLSNGRATDRTGAAADRHDRGAADSKSQNVGLRIVVRNVRVEKWRCGAEPPEVK